MTVLATKKDFRIDWFSGSGAGGQHRNKHMNCCRITHIESGLVGSSQEYKSQQQNKKAAFGRLVKLLVAHYAPKYDKERYAAGENVIRTYNESKDYVKDHDTGEVFSYRQTVGKEDLSEIIESRLHKMLDKLRENE